jgi:tRNA U38,U39,U40 pseudouridine synthase TruA
MFPLPILSCFLIWRGKILNWQVSGKKLIDTPVSWYRDTRLIPATNNLSSKKLISLHVMMTTLCVQLMGKAASKLVGEHDFRNLCKMDVGNGVTTFKRRVLHTEVAVLDQL